MSTFGMFNCLRTRPYIPGCNCTHCFLIFRCFDPRVVQSAVLFRLPSNKGVWARVGLCRFVFNHVGLAQIEPVVLHKLFQGYSSHSFGEGGGCLGCVVSVLLDSYICVEVTTYVDALVPPGVMSPFSIVHC